MISKAKHCPSRRYKDAGGSSDSASLVQQAHKTVEQPLSQFIDKVVDDSVMMQKQVPAVQVRREVVEAFQSQFSDKVVDPNCATENRCHRCSS